MQQMNITIDTYGCLICGILLLYLLAGNRYRDRLRCHFLWMTVFCLGINLGDLVNWTCEGLAQPWYPVVLWTGTIIFWLSTSLLLLSFTAYLVAYLYPKVRVDRRFLYAVVLLCVVHIGGTLLSVFNGIFFTITPENVYQRGTWFWLSQAIPFALYLVDVLIFVTYRKSLSKRDFSLLSSYIALPVLAELIQSLHYGVALLGAGVTAALLIIFINIQFEQELRMERQEKKLTEQRVDIMLSQIQPHFLYNSLITIRGLCDINPTLAKESISDFSKFLRANMRFLKSKAPIPFEQELLHVKSYLALEQQRFQSRLHIIYDIECMDFSVPPLTVQPIVENAVRHGVLRREEGGTVTLKTEETEGFYLVIVSDDGLGMGTLRSMPDELDDHAHIGIENVRSRLKTLCRGTIDMQSEDGVGTTVTITIPKETSL